LVGRSSVFAEIGYGGNKPQISQIPPITELGLRFG
jgi:hypothetical protein